MTPVIFEMYKIFEDLNIEKVLDNVLDKHKSEINHLSKNQLIDECKKLGLPHQGKKVNTKFFAISVNHCAFS